MNDGQVNFMAEMKKMQEMMMSTVSFSGRSDNYGMMKDFFALQAEVKQMKEDQEKQKVEYKKMYEDLEKQNDAIEKLKMDQEKVLEEQKIEMEKMKKAHEKALKEQQDEYEKVSIKMIRKQEILDLKITGKWKMVESTGCEEYEQHRLADDSYRGYCAKIDFENREFTYDDALTLKSYVDNNTEDPSFKSDYYVKGRRVVYGHKSNYATTPFQWINVYLENEQLVVLASIYKDSEQVAACWCYYDRV